MALFCLKANAYAIWEGPFNSTWEDTGMFRFLEQAYLKSYKIRNKLFFRDSNMFVHTWY